MRPSVNPAIIGFCSTSLVKLFDGEWENSFYMPPDHMRSKSDTNSTA